MKKAIPIQFFRQRGGVPSVSVTEISADGLTQGITYNPIAGSLNYITTKFVITGSGLTTKNITLDLASVSFPDPDDQKTTITVKDSHLYNCTLTLSADSKSLSATCFLMPVEKKFSIVVIAKDNTTGKTIFTSNKPIDYSLVLDSTTNDAAICGFPGLSQVPTVNNPRTPMSAAFECFVLRGDNAYGGNISNKPSRQQDKWQLIGTDQAMIWMAPVSPDGTRKIWSVYPSNAASWCDVNDSTQRQLYKYDSNNNLVKGTDTYDPKKTCSASSSDNNVCSSINNFWRLPTFPDIEEISGDCSSASPQPSSPSFCNANGFDRNAPIPKLVGDFWTSDVVNTKDKDTETIYSSGAGSTTNPYMVQIPDFPGGGITSVGCVMDYPVTITATKLN